MLHGFNVLLEVLTILCTSHAVVCLCDVSKEIGYASMFDDIGEVVYVLDEENWP